MRGYFLLLFVFAVLSLTAQKQPPIPERIVTIHADAKRTDAVLLDIANQAKFEFAWNAQLFDPARAVTIHADNITVRRAIYLLFGNTITFKVKGNYLILLSAPTPISAAAPPEKKKEFLIDGYITDFSKTEKIKDASVYDSLNLNACLTDAYGHYTINLTSSMNPVRIKISKTGYYDTSFLVFPHSNQSIDMPLRLIPVIIPIAHKIDTLNTKTLQKDSISQNETKPEIRNYRLLDSIIGYEQLMQARNLTTKFKRQGQISVLPFVSTNGEMGGAVRNNFSFNLIGGYTGGTNIAELGLVFNIDQGNVQWVQMAGGFNMVEGNCKGLQLGGGANINMGTMMGLQLTGGVNLLFDSLRGAQVAGGSNFSNGIIEGGQISGGVNIAMKKITGAQISGGANIGFDTVIGSQVAGGLNFARWLYGTQFAIVNIAQEVSGFQIGLLNIADTCSKGAMIGFLSISRRGIHELGISTTEKGFLNLSFRTGTSQFYNILRAGINSQYPNIKSWAFGYGIGHRFVLHPKFQLALDLTMDHVNKNDLSAYTNEWIQLLLSAEWRPVKRFAITAGPVLNYFVTGGSEDDLISFHPSPFYNYTNRGFQHMGWIGASFSLRFF
jgi:hypothetical protein